MMKGTPHRVEFVPDPVAWTEVPESITGLGRQRDRWHRGLADVMWRYKRMLFNPRYRALGMVVYPYFLFFELLAPVVETIGLIGVVVGLLIGAFNVPFAMLFFLVAYVFGIVLSALTLALEEISFHRYGRFRDRLLLLIWTLIEPFGYRQMTVYWRFRGLIKFLRKKKDWGVMSRKGFASSAPKPDLSA